MCQHRSLSKDGDPLARFCMRSHTQVDAFRYTRSRRDCKDRKLGRGSPSLANLLDLLVEPLGGDRVGSAQLLGED